MLGDDGVDGEGDDSWLGGVDGDFGLVDELGWVASELLSN